MVIAGENRNYVVALGLASAPNIADDNVVRERMRTKLATPAEDATGSTQRVLRFAFLTENYSVDAGDMTDNGALSQRNILRKHAAFANSTLMHHRST